MKAPASADREHDAAPYSDRALLFEYSFQHSFSARSMRPVPPALYIVNIMPAIS